MEPKEALPLLGFRRRLPKYKCPASPAVLQVCRTRGTPCPKSIHINLRRVSSVECGNELPRLHMDHTHDVKHICRVWSEALPEQPRSWDDGVCGTEDHLLTQCTSRPVWRKQLILRCGDVKGIKGQQADHFCHDIAGAHYDHALQVKDIQWPVAKNSVTGDIEKSLAGGVTESAMEARTTIEDVTQDA